MCLFAPTVCIFSYQTLRWHADHNSSHENCSSNCWCPPWQLKEQSVNKRSSSSWWRLHMVPGLITHQSQLEVKKVSPQYHPAVKHERSPPVMGSEQSPFLAFLVQFPFPSPGGVDSRIIGVHLLSLHGAVVDVQVSVTAALIRTSAIDLEHVRAQTRVWMEPLSSRAAGLTGLIFL